MKSVARIISIVCHPLFVPTLVMAFLVKFSPSLFYGLDSKQQILRIITVAYTTITFPLLTVFLLWRLQFIENMYMRNPKERYVPLIASMLFYFWVFWLFHKQFHAPSPIQVFLLGAFLSSVLTFLFNLFNKVSMHSAAFGLVSALAIYLAILGVSGSWLFLVLSLLLAGAVSSSRLFLKEHTPGQVYTGLGIGAAALLLAIPVIKLIS